MAVTKQANQVNQLSQSLGLTTGLKPTIEQLNQLIKAAGPSLNVNAPRPAFKTGQGFDPEDFSKRLIEAPVSAQNRFAQAMTTAQTTEQTTSRDLSFETWLPQFDDVELQGLAAAAVDQIEKDIPNADLLAKGVRLYEYLKDSHTDALQQDDDELAEKYGELGTTIRDHMAEHGVDVDMEE